MCRPDVLDLKPFREFINPQGNAGGDEMPDIKGWTWGEKVVQQGASSTEADNV